jgi:hypothetical protein
MPYSNWVRGGTSGFPLVLTYLNATVSVPHPQSKDEAMRNVLVVLLQGRQWGISSFTIPTPNRDDASNIHNPELPEQDAEFRMVAFAISKPTSAFVWPFELNGFTRIRCGECMPGFIVLLYLSRGICLSPTSTVERRKYSVLVLVQSRQWGHCYDTDT